MGVRSVALSSLSDVDRSDSIMEQYRRNNPLSVEYLVIAGGGGTAAFYSGGGGAGGYRSSVIGENSGGGALAEPPLSLNLGTSYLIAVGAGGAGEVNGAPATQGISSMFSVVSSVGGGRTGYFNATERSGGSGGGGSPSSFGSPYTTGGTSTSGQGFNGGSNTVTNNATGGGGGAGAAGGVPSGNNAGNGGVGITSAITGTGVARGGGGGGGGLTGGSASGGGGAGSYNTQASPGNANTGGGGGGRYEPAAVGSRFGQTGGSGIVILRYPAFYTATFSGGVTQTTSTVGDFKISEITATSTTSETVAFA